MEMKTGETGACPPPRSKRKEFKRKNKKTGNRKLSNRRNDEETNLK